MSAKEKKEKVLPYRLLDSGNLKKLEQVGPYRLVRPALNAFWGPTLDEEEWASADAVFTRDNSGGGKWDFKRRLPESWLVEYAGFTLKMKPTNFGHLGFSPNSTATGNGSAPGISRADSTFSATPASAQWPWRQGAQRCAIWMPPGA